MVESNTRTANAIPEQSLHLRRQTPGLLGRNHQILIFRLPIVPFGKEEANILSNLIPVEERKKVSVIHDHAELDHSLCDVCTASMISVPEEDQSVADCQLCGDSLKHLWGSLRTPNMRSWDHLGGSVLRCDLADGRNTTQERWMIHVSRVEVSVHQYQPYESLSVVQNSILTHRHGAGLGPCHLD